MSVRQVWQTVLRRPFSAAATNVWEFIAEFDGFLVETLVRSDNTVDQDTFFDVNLNETSFWDGDQANRPKITSAGTEQRKTGLAFTVAKGDTITVDLDTAPTTPVTNPIGDPLSIALHFEEGGLALPIRSESANYTVVLADHTILVDCSGGNRTVTLPTLSSTYDSGIDRGAIYHVKKIDSSANTLTVDGNGSETIDGATTKVLTAQYESITIQAGPTEWSIL